MIPFNRPCLVGKEFEYMRVALEQGHLSGNGPFTKRCSRWLELNTGCVKALMTHSCTAALEMAALLLDCGPGDEVIMPSFAFVSTANAFVLRGATPVFVDVRPETMTIDPELVERAVTSRTKAIVALHYAGVSCDMDALSEIAARHSVAIVEDAAQAIFSSYRGKPLGGIGTFGALSFHETKNVISGEGGALLINDARYMERAEILWEKGTNRNQFFRGAVDKYTWVDVGSSFLPSELICAFLQAQLESAQQLTSIRLGLWRTYHSAFEDLEAAGQLRRPIVPDACGHNAHMYYVLTGEGIERGSVLAALNDAGIGAVFHYVPLHSSPAGRRFGRAAGKFTVTDELSERLVRLPLWPGLTSEQIDTVIGGVRRCLSPSTPSLMSPSVSVVVPVYNSAVTLRPLVARLTTVLESSASRYEIILVDDGSRDDSPNVARALQAEYAAVKVLRLLRNYGQHNAILCGLRHARHSLIVTLDDDLQHPPEEIPRLLETLGDRYDLVYGMAEHEQHGLLRDLASRVTKIVMQQVLGVESARKVSGFRVFRVVLRAALEEFNGPYVNIDVMLTWATTRIEGIPVRHEPRRVGRSNYTLRWLMRHALNMLTGFSVLPLRVSSVLGFVLTLFGVVALVFVMGRYLLFGVVVPGFSFLASIIIVFSGTQLFALGIIGEYLARMHFRLLGRPTYAIRTDDEDPLSKQVS